MMTQVEQIRHDIFGLPLIIGGTRNDDGSISGKVFSLSEEAKKIGITVGMTAQKAHQICPHLIMEELDLMAYKSISEQIIFVIKKYVENYYCFSFNDYMLEVPFLKERNRGEIFRFSRKLQDDLSDSIGLYTAIGVGKDRKFATIASSIARPRGIIAMLSVNDLLKNLE